MNIIVCMKEIVHPLHIMPGMIVSETRELDFGHAKTMANPYDALAVEAALQIRNQWGGGSITLLSAGPDSAENTLQKGLAMGGDKAIRVWDKSFSGADAFVIATILGKAVKRLELDLVLCGYKSIDSGSSQIPGMLAEALEVPFISGAIDIEFNPLTQGITVLKKLERGDREKLVCPLPAVVSVDHGSLRPRYPTLPRVLAAKKARIELINKKTLGLGSPQTHDLKGLTRVEAYAPPRPRAKKFSAPDSSLSAAERLKLLMSGGVQERGGNSLEGRPENIASSFVKFLSDESIITKNEVKS